ncbi:TPA: hypothetical protein ACH3X3_008360 [Trebouxia sp. C0006]
MVARSKAALSLRDRSSAAHALGTFLQQLHHWAQEHTEKFVSIASSVALLSVTHLAAKALDWGGPQNPLVPSIAAMLIKMNLREMSEASNQSVCNVFWACGRLPDDVHPGFEDQLVQRFIDTQASATLQDGAHGVSMILWACASWGYLPPPYMLECLKKSYATSEKPPLLQCNDSTMLWSLTVLGMLDMEFFKIMILRRPRQLQQIADVQRIHQALHALRALDKISAAYTEWSEIQSTSSYKTASQRLLRL